MKLEDFLKQENLTLDEFNENFVKVGTVTKEEYGNYILLPYNELRDKVLKGNNGSDHNEIARLVTIDDMGIYYDSKQVR